MGRRHIFPTMRRCSICDAHVAPLCGNARNSQCMGTEQWTKMAGVLAEYIPVGWCYRFRWVAFRIDQRNANPQIVSFRDWDHGSLFTEFICRHRYHRNMLASHTDMHIDANPPQHQNFRLIFNFSLNFSQITFLGAFWNTPFAKRVDLSCASYFELATECQTNYANWLGWLGKFCRQKCWFSSSTTINWTGKKRKLFEYLSHCQTKTPPTRIVKQTFLLHSSRQRCCWRICRDLSAMVLAWMATTVTSNTMQPFRYISKSSSILASVTVSHPPRFVSTNDNFQKHTNQQRHNKQSLQVHNR